MVGPILQFNLAARFVVSLVSVHSRRSFVFDSLISSLSLSSFFCTFLSLTLLSLSISLCVPSVSHTHTLVYLLPQSLQLGIDRSIVVVLCGVVGSARATELRENIH